MRESHRSRVRRLKASKIRRQIRNRARKRRLIRLARRAKVAAVRDRLGQQVSASGVLYDAEGNRVSL